MMIGMFIFFLAILSFVKSATSSEALLKVRSTTTNSTLLPYKEWYGKRIMFIHAHTDDMECASGGLITLLKDIAEVFVVIVTNGDKGCGNDAICGNVTNTELVAIRQTEQLNSAKFLGIPVENVVFMSYEDCLLNSYPEQTVLKDIVTIVRKFQPHIVFTWDPSPKFELLASEGWGDLGYHPDHQTSGKRALDAVWCAELERMWPEVGAAWKAEALYFWAFTPLRTPDFFLDTTPSAVFGTKVEAFLQMKSQYTQASQVVGMLETVGRRVAQTVGLSTGSTAEGYNYILW